MNNTNSRMSAEDFSKLWNDNYSGNSDIAKSLEGYLKNTYTGMKYLSWAVMVRVLYTLDPDAVLEKVCNESGGYVFTDHHSFEVYRDNAYVRQEMLSHFVKVNVTFMGRTFSEAYAIQDKSYNAAKTYDQNMVNKALQRAVAKCISTATGIGFSLYENGDLQFEDDGVITDDATPPVVRPTATREPKSKVAPPATTESTMTSKVDTSTVVSDGEPTVIERLTDMIIKYADHTDAIKILGSYNTVLSTKYGFKIDPKEDTKETIMEKLGSVKNCETMLKGFIKGVKSDA